MKKRIYLLEQMDKIFDSRSMHSHLKADLESLFDSSDSVAKIQKLLLQAHAEQGPVGIFQYKHGNSITTFLYNSTMDDKMFCVDVVDARFLPLTRQRLFRLSVSEDE